MTGDDVMDRLRSAAPGLPAGGELAEILRTLAERVAAEEALPPGRAASRTRWWRRTSVLVPAVAGGLALSMAAGYAIWYDTQSRDFTHGRVPAPRGGSARAGGRRRGRLGREPDAGRGRRGAWRPCPRGGGAEEQLRRSRGRYPVTDPQPDAGQARAWLLGVARRTVANHRRGTVRRDRLAGRLRDHLLAQPVSAPEPDQRLHDALRRLSPQDRELLTLSAWDDLTPAQLAIVLGLSPQVTRKRLERARSRLRAILEPPSGAQLRATEGRGGGAAPAAPRSEAGTPGAEFGVR